MSRALIYETKQPTYDYYLPSQQEELIIAVTDTVAPWAMEQSKTEGIINTWPLCVNNY